MNINSGAITYARENQKRFIEELTEFIKFPSISTNPDNYEGIQLAAHWVAENLKKSGCQQVKIIPTAKHPIVFAEYRPSLPAEQTVLIYGHYDVQPVEPLDLWKSDPFSARLDGEFLYGRGSSDMKGQIMACIKAFESIIRMGELPLNLKFLIEGEEEIGSPNLEDFLKVNKDLLSCDIVFNPDAGMISSTAPTITYGLRGLAFFELFIYGPDHDLHSGLFGGIVHNPAQVLCDTISRMHDLKGRITLPGFYDLVESLSPIERSEFGRLPVTDEYYLEQTGVPSLWGEEGYSPVERIGARPTLEINGMYSGFINSGAKTIIPAYAMAKISMRLVPNQEPSIVHRQFMEFLQANIPETVRWKLNVLTGGPGCITNRSLSQVLSLAKALEEVWGIPPFYKREGGSIPVVAEVKKILGVDSVLTGFGLPEDNIHAPNERLHLITWQRGIEAVIHFLYNLI
jgi:acetylornithine deacetylase/succinyl-diaminopimelate desuccinylase-like protein